MRSKDRDGLFEAELSKLRTQIDPGLAQFELLGSHT